MQPFDLAACILDLGTPVASPAGLGDLPAERGLPPPTMDRIALVDAKTAVQTAAKLVATFPKTWSPRIELATSLCGRRVRIQRAKYFAI